MLNKFFICVVFLVFSGVLQIEAKDNEKTVKPTNSVKNNMTKFFGQLGVYSHVNKAEVYNAQRAGYMTGGGVSLRNHITDVKLAHIQLPSFDAGCGGIDIFSGGFSFINHDQLIYALKDIASAAAGYAFMLGIETQAPMIANNLKQMQSWANTINNIGINSCETATQLVGAVWPQNTAAKQHICNATQPKKGIFSDYIGARHQCSQPDQFSQSMTNIQKNSRYRDFLGEEYNVAWQAIQKQPYLVSNQDLAELFMGLTGTIIVRKKDGEIELERWPSKVYDENFLHVLLNGGTAKTYQCSNSVDNSKNDKCLLVQEANLIIAANDSFQGKIKMTLDTIYSKVINDEILEEAEQSLLMQTRIPLYQVINVLTAYNRGPSPIDLHDVAELVAIDILTQSLREVVEIMRFASLQLAKAQMFEFEIKDYIEELSRVDAAIREFEVRYSRRIELENQLLNKIDILEKDVATRINIF